MEKPSLDTAKAGAMRFNTDSSQLEIYDGNQWTGILATSPEQILGGTRLLFMGGTDGSSTVDVIQYVNIATTGNAIDFGNLLHPRWREHLVAVAQEDLFGEIQLIMILNLLHFHLQVMQQILEI